MSLRAILAAVAGFLILIAGVFIGRPLGKADGRKEGAQQVEQKQKVEQAQAITEAVKERNDVETKIAVTPRDDIDRELSEFSRPD